MNRGQRDGTKTNKTDPEVPGGTKLLKQEEINVRKEENKLRDENDLDHRVLP